MKSHISNVAGAIFGIFLFQIHCGASLVTNGGFEDPPLPNGFAVNIVANLPGWELETGEAELQRFLNLWLPFEGSQYTELTHQHAMRQTISTIPGRSYQFSYAYSARPTVEQNPLDVYLNLELVGSYNASGSNLTNTSWTLYSHTFTATAADTIIEFRATPAGEGTFVDAVSVVPAAPPNLIFNGGFESPILQPGRVIDIVSPLPGWDLEAGGAELQRFLNGWEPYEGTQYTEVTHQQRMSQLVPTEPGQAYRLSYAYSARPTVELNPLEVFVDSELIASHEASGVGHSNTDWTLYSHTFFAMGTETLIEFRATPAGVGTFLDAVTLTIVPEPSAFLILLPSLVFVGRYRQIQQR